MTAGDELTVAELFERARMEEAVGGLRKQHIVPASYLQRWAEGGQVRVTDLELSPRRTYCGNPRKIGLERDFYRLEADGLDEDDVPPLALEVLMSVIESEAKLGIDELLTNGEPSVKHGGYLAWFIALQATRGRAHRASMRAAAHEVSKLQVEGLDSAEAVRRQMVRNGADPSEEEVAHGLSAVQKVLSGEWVVGPQEAVLAALAAQTAGELVKYLLLGRQWIVYDTPPILVTCDEPVVPLAGPAGHRAEQGGFGDAPVILVPLEPSKLLVLLRNDLEREDFEVLDRAEVADINRELVASSARWVFERPSRKVGMGMPVPGPPPPLVHELHEGSREEGRVVYRQHRPTRWVAAPYTPWPVPRWWERWS